MIPNEARRLCIILSKVDNHCGVCMAEMIPDLRAAFPEFCWEVEIGWPRIVARPNTYGVTERRKRVKRAVSRQRSAAAKARWARWRAERGTQ